MTRQPVPLASIGALGTRHLRGLVFSTPAGFRQLELDLILPSAPADGAVRGLLPTVVYVHGGGWRQGSRDDPGPAFRSMSPGLFERIAAAGLAVATVDYRLSGEAVWPAQLEDVAAAVRWIRQHGTALGLGLDPDRIALMGESAGAHLAASAALRGDDAVYGAGRVAGVVDWYGPTDIRASTVDAHGKPPGPDGAGEREAALLGAPVAEVPHVAAEASPITHVTRAAAPPFLIMHGAVDRLVSSQQSIDFAHRLRQCEVETELHVIDEVDHMWAGADSLVLDEIVQLTLRFLTLHLDIKGVMP